MDCRLGFWTPVKVYSAMPVGLRKISHEFQRRKRPIYTPALLKPATTETGLVVPVPNFIDIGELIRVDTESGAYLSRAKGD